MFQSQLMTYNIYIRFLITAIFSVILFSNSFSQYSQISNEEIILRTWKANEIIPYNNEITKIWLRTFDKSFTAYKNNEFKLSENIEKTNKYLFDQLLKTEKEKLFFIDRDLGIEFGKYDFTKLEFEFNPFKPSYQINLQTKCIDIYNDYCKEFNTLLLIKGLEFVNGLPMPKDKAEFFLESRTENNRTSFSGEKYINRKIYIRIYYSQNIEELYTSTDWKIGNYPPKTFGILGTPIIVQAFNDFNRKIMLYEWRNPNAIFSKFYNLNLGKSDLSSSQSNTSSYHTSEDINSNQILERSEIMPAFVGGNDEIKKYIKNNLNYPFAAKKNNIEGTVIVKFFIDENGYTNKPEIIKDNVGGGASDEAKRLINNMPRWYPGLQNGNKVKVYYTLPITFSLFETNNFTEPDRDNDGIPDIKDKCPDIQGDLSNNGCPEKETKKSFVARNIQFETGSSVLKQNSYTILDNLIDLMRSYSFYNLRIEGHCDASEVKDTPLSIKLSQERANVTMKYLISKGIETERLEAFGYGSTKPINNDNTDTGKAQNRRVELNLFFK